ncbi:3-methyl-2-oxobutanoate hydroxymethyltransferase, partial [Prosthecodimorpha staleyi]
MRNPADGRNALGELTDRKGRRRIVAAGASTAPFARIIDSYVDMLLVDCGLVATIHGIDRPMDVSLDLMVAHGQAVMRASRRAAVVVELPAKCCEDTPDRALQDAEFLIESVGCAGIALAIEVETIEIIRLLADSGIPVLGLTEIGTPRRSHVSESDDPDWRRLQVAHNAQAAASAGAFAVLATGSEDSLAEELARTVGVPVIGDESASVCDGQFLTDLDFMSMLTNVRSSNRSRSPAVRLVETRNTAPIETGIGPTGMPQTGIGPTGYTQTGYTQTGSRLAGSGPAGTTPAATGSIKLPPKPVAPVPEPVVPRPTAEARPVPPAPARRPAAPPPVEPAEPEAIEEMRPAAPEPAPVRPAPAPVRRLPAAPPVHLSPPPPAPHPAPPPAP